MGGWESPELQVACPGLGFPSLLCELGFSPSPHWALVASPCVPGTMLGALPWALSCDFLLLLYPWAGPSAWGGVWQVWLEAGKLAHLLQTKKLLSAKEDQIPAWVGP